MRHRTLIYAIAAFSMQLWACGPLPAQENGQCSTAGYRVLAQRWDAILQKTWELRQDCKHPEWPARAIALNIPHPNDAIVSAVAAPPRQLVQAGDRVRLWMQDAHSRIEISGVAGQSAAMGERVTIRIPQQFQDDGFAVQLVPGTVRGNDDVEMDR